MLRVEICIDSDEDHEIGMGTYKLNSMLSSSIQICEYYSKGMYDVDTLYEGYANLTDNKRVEKYFYKAHTEEKKHEYYIEETLPCKKYKNLWSNIIYNERDKYNIFEKLMRLEDASKETRDLFGIGKCVLICGEPGTGKTTICKAIAQKLAIRRNRTYKLRRIQCTQLFSRFYGETMKIVEKVLQCETDDTIVVIDEADSILMKRSELFSKNEPGDSIRVVNTLLYTLDSSDKLFIFVTNFKDQLDEAFLSRCDFIFEMKRLGHRQSYSLLKALFEGGYGSMTGRSCFTEFSSVEICGSLADEASLLLFEISKKVTSMSPRKIKKLFFELIEPELMDPIIALKKLEQLLN
ncbi:Pachytene checkpoint protein 2 [Glugoides intestinalis]